MPKCPKCEEENPQLGAKCPRDGFYYVYDDAFDLAQSDPRIGTMLVDKYVIIGRISKGGMGAVYRAMQLPVEREVAFKVLRTEMEGSDKSRDRFIREARAVSRLTHPNIITLYDFGFDDDQHPYMVMEYAPGQDMGRWLRQGDLTIERILHVIRQLLSALDAAHAEGIIHRDLKPENMIITQTSRDRDCVKLLDFGIARMINETNTRGLTREGEVFGTPHYMAPEQAQGAKTVGPQADIYAVGIMLYELITGEPAFDAPTPLAVLLMHINEPLPQVVPRPGVHVSPEILQLLERATAKNPEHRFAHAGDMLTALDQILIQQGLTSSHGALMSIAAADLTGDFSRPTQRTPRPVHITEQESMMPTMDSFDDLPVAAPQSGVAIHDPDPSEVLYTSDLIPQASAAASSASGTYATYDTTPPSSSSNKKALLALAVIVFLLIAAGGIVVALSIDNTKQSTAASGDIQDTTTAVQDSLAQKQDTPTPQEEDPSPQDPTPPVKVEEPDNDPSTTLTDVPETTPDIEQVDPNDTVEKPDTSSTATASSRPPTPQKKVDPPKKVVTPTKTPAKTTTATKDTTTTPASDPPEQETPPKKDPGIKKDAWGAPTKEQIEKFKKKDKW